jgi:hypothetical protein
MASNGYLEPGSWQRAKRQERQTCNAIAGLALVGLAACIVAVYGALLLAVNLAPHVREWSKGDASPLDVLLILALTLGGVLYAYCVGV